jgi:hypothetical protein
LWIQRRGSRCGSLSCRFALNRNPLFFSGPKHGLTSSRARSTLSLQPAGRRVDAACGREGVWVPLRPHARIHARCSLVRCWALVRGQHGDTHPSSPRLCSCPRSLLQSKLHSIELHSCPIAVVGGRPWSPCYPREPSSFPFTGHADADRGMVASQI